MQLAAVMMRGSMHHCSRDDDITQSGGEDDQENLPPKAMTTPKLLSTSVTPRDPKIPEMMMHTPSSQAKNSRGH